MQSTLTPDVTDPHDIFVIEHDVVLATRADRPAAGSQPAEQVHGKVSPDLASPGAASPVKPPVNLAEAILGDILNKPSTPAPSSPRPRVAPEISVAAPMQPVKSTPRVDATFRATAASADAIAGAIKASNEIKVPEDIRLNGPRPARGAWARRALVAFLFAFGSVVAAQGWHRYGDTARHMVAQWTPALAQLLPSSRPAATIATTQPRPDPAAADQSGLPAAAQAAVPPAQTAVADQTASPPAPAAIVPAQDAPAATTAAAAPSAQQLQSMTQDIASMGQQIESLKATIAQLKAGQEQMAQQISRDAVRSTVVRNSEAKVTEPRGHVAPPPRHQAYAPAPPPVRRPVRATYYPPPASGMNVPPPPPYPAPPPPVAAQSMDAMAPDGDPVVRPPMPLH